MKPQVTNKYIAQFKIPTNSIEPDIFESASNSIFPDHNFVISRDINGETLSVYGDNVWNLTPYNPRRNYFAIVFDEIVDELDGVNPICLEQMKQFIFILIYKSPVPISLKTLLHFHHLNFNLIRFAHKCDCLITDLLSTDALFIELIRFLPGSQYKLLKSLIIKFIQIGKEETGVEIIGGWSLKELTNLKRINDQKYKQHPPVPTAIYSALIKSLLQELDDFNKNIPVIFEILLTAIKNPLYGKCASSRHRKKVKNSELRSELSVTEFKNIMVSYDLQNFMESKGLSKSLRGLGRYLTEVQIVCKLLIHVFSGMRDEEAQYLLYDCLFNKTFSGKNHIFIEGLTTKLGIKRTVWITSEEGKKAIDAAKMIADFIYSNCLNDKPSSKDKMKYPLLISTSYLPFMSKSIKSNVGYGVTTTELRPAKKLSKRILAKITKEDIAELEMIDAHRAWSSESKFQVGEDWPLTTHQLRRSLALYATSSGFVSLTSLKRQLQHITEEMSLYYARGSAYAKSLTGGDQSDFAMDYQLAQPEGQALSWIFNVLFSHDKLGGAHGVWVENNMKSKDGVLINHDRDETIKKFKNGQMAYKETPLGGCATVDPCNKRVLRSLVACLDCKSAVIQPSKLKNVINIQRKLVESLDVNSVEYRIEKEDLSAFEKVENKLSRSQ